MKFHMRHCFFGFPLQFLVLTSLNVPFTLDVNDVTMSFQVLEWPSPVRNGAVPVEGPSINSVAMDPELRYLVALSDKNMVVIWKRASEP